LWWKEKKPTLHKYKRREREGGWIWKQHIPKIGVLWRTDVHLGPAFQHLAPLQLVARVAVGIEDDADPQGSWKINNNNIISQIAQGILLGE
jgi:hypothetical protein